MNVPQAQHHPYPTRRRIRSTIQVTKKLLTAAAFLIFTICSSGRLFVTLFDSTTAAINYGSNPDDVRSRLALPVLTRLENTTTKEYPTIANTSSSNSNSMHEDEFDTVCLTTPCLIHEVRKYHLARAFPSREKDSWCIPTTDLQQQQQLNGNNNNNNLTRDQVWQGLLYVKVPKAASSTTAGLTIRVARRHHCAAYEYMHRPGMEYASRDTNHSLLFASIRDPGERALSSVWFFVLSPSTIEATDTNIITSLHTRRGGGKTRGKGGFQYNYVSLQPIPPRSVWTPFVPDKILHAPSLRNQLANLLRSYDFLIVVERMDESMTAFALLAGLSMSDVLVASSKVVSNEYVLARVGRNAGVCEHKGRPPTSPGIRAYLESDEWRIINYADYLLYHAANISLDMTIQRIGSSRFDRALADFRRRKAFVLRVCGDRLGSGCSNNGTPTSPMEECYDNDFGCGYKCIDEALSNYSEY